MTSATSCQKHRLAHRFTHTWSNKRKHMRGTTGAVKPLKEAISVDYPLTLELRDSVV